MSKIYSLLEQLLGTQTPPEISHLQDAEAILADCLRWNNEAFTKWVENNRCANGRDVQDHFRNLLLSAERELDTLHTWGDLAEKADLERALIYLSDFQLPQRKEVYLKDDSALYLLTKLPPTYLMRAMDIKTIEDLFYKFTALDVIALTRHTEPKEWQVAYLRELEELTSVHFETRPVRFLTVDRAFLKRASAEAGRVLKPWSASHNKETGTITFYTFDSTRRVTTPNLLVTMLFFHYYFEIVGAARLASESGRQAPKKIGARFSQIIRSTERTFSFDHPNVHSEALYWEDAITYLSTLFPRFGFREYLALLSCGDFISDAAPQPVSLNLVDHLWDLNLNYQSSYLAGEEETFLYHFREMFWTGVLQTLRRLSRSDMRSTVFSQLDVDDAMFTQQLLKQKGPDNS